MAPQPPYMCCRDTIVVDPAPAIVGSQLPFLPKVLKREQQGRLLRNFPFPISSQLLPPTTFFLLSPSPYPRIDRNIGSREFLIVVHTLCITVVPCLHYIYRNPFVCHLELSFYRPSPINWGPNSRNLHPCFLNWAAKAVSLVYCSLPLLCLKCYSTKLLHRRYR